MKTRAPASQRSFWTLFRSVLQARLRCLAVRLAISGLVLLPAFSSPAEGVVTQCTEASLRAALNGGGLVTFSCSGTIVLTSTITVAQDTVIDGAGHQVTLSGAGQVRVFHVQPNIAFTLNHLAIAHGRSTNGAAILNVGGTVSVSDTLFQSNSVVGAAGSATYPGGPGESVTGGALYTSGVLNLFDCTFRGNCALGGNGSDSWGGSVGAEGGYAFGGAICNYGSLTAIGCTFAENLAKGGNGGSGGSSIPIPGAQGYPGGAGGHALGGVIWNGGTGHLINCTLALNTGSGGMGGPGGPGYPYPGWPPREGQPGPPGPNGNSVGAIEDISGNLAFTNCTMVLNSGMGIRTAGGTALINTLLSDNLPLNCSGSMIDRGHNLSSDTSCGFTNAGSMNNTYPLLGMLTNNGGATPTIALLPGCLAIDAADTGAAPALDQRGVQRPFGPAADIGAYEFNQVVSVTNSIVAEPTEAALRAALSGGGKVTFACDGIIPLSRTILITTNACLDANYRQIAISGGGAVRLFEVPAGVEFSVANLSLIDGGSPRGAAILNTGGSLRLTNCFIAGNHAGGSGGAIRSESGKVYLVGCVFTNNSAAGAPGISVSGGAVDNSGVLEADLCLFIRNSAAGGAGANPPPGVSGADGGPGGHAWGGAICNSGTLILTRSTLTNNSATGGAGSSGAAGHHGDPGMSGGSGGAGGPGGDGLGGAIYNSGTASVNGATVVNNQGTGGVGGDGGAGGPSYGSGSGGNGGVGAQGGHGAGGLMSSGTLHLINSTLALNAGSGRNGGSGGAAGTGNFGGSGGAGGQGGSGSGALHALSSCWITNSTIALNSASAGSGGSGGSGGAGSYQSGLPGSAGTSGSAAGGIRSLVANAMNTILSENAPGGNCSGSIADLGHNLSSDGSCAFTNSGSMNNQNAGLGPLGDNGGPTPVLPLLSSSAAIDAADAAAAPVCDQRGCPRPAGLGPDIGAFEFGSVMPQLELVREGGSLKFVGSGNPNKACRLMISFDLVHWEAIATNQLGGDGKVVFQGVCGTGTGRYYRLAMP